MNEESKELLRQIVDAQKEQTELLRKHVLPLWTRIRFSLLGLLVLMTLVAVGVGITAFAIRSQNSTVPLPQQTRTRTPMPAGATEDLFGEAASPTDDPFAE
jgi:hypothetical protein